MHRLIRTPALAKMSRIFPVKPLYFKKMGQDGQMSGKNVFDDAWD